MKIHEYIIIPLELENKQSKEVIKCLRRSKALLPSYLLQIRQINRLPYPPYVPVPNFECFGYIDSERDVDVSVDVGAYKVSYRLLLGIHGSSLCFILYAVHDISTNIAMNRIWRIRTRNRVMALEGVENNISILHRISQLCDAAGISMKNRRTVRKSRYGQLKFNPECSFSMYIFQMDSHDKDTDLYAHVLTQKNPYSSQKPSISTISYQNISCFIASSIAVFITDTDRVKITTKFALGSIIPILTAWNRSQVFARKVSTYQRHGLQIDHLIECRESIFRSKVRSSLTATISHAFAETELDFQERLDECLLLTRNKKVIVNEDILDLLSSEIDTESMDIAARRTKHSTFSNLLVFLAIFTLTFASIVTASFGVIIGYSNNEDASNRLKQITDYVNYLKPFLIILPVTLALTGIGILISAYYWLKKDKRIIEYEKSKGLK